MPSLYTFNDPVPSGFDVPLKRMYWINGSRISSTGAASPPPTWPVSGILSEWSNEDWYNTHEYMATLALARGDDLIFVDAEAIPFTNINYSNLIYAINGVRAGHPSAKIAMYYGPFLSEINRTTLNTQVATNFNALVAEQAGFADLYNLLDYINMPSYLLGESYVQRDFDYMTGQKLVAQAAFPNVGRIYSVWGVYHTSFNAPENQTISQSVLRDYANLATSDGKNVAIFAPESNRDGFFVNLLHQIIHAALKVIDADDYRNNGRVTVGSGGKPRSFNIIDTSQDNVVNVRANNDIKRHN